MSDGLIEVYAAKTDIDELIGIVNTSPYKKLVAMNGRLNRDIEYLHLPISIDDVEYGQNYMLVDEDHDVVARKSIQKDGSGYRYVVNQTFNPESIVFNLGEQLPENILIVTSISTNGDSGESVRHLKSLRRKIIKSSEKMSLYFVMDGAKEKLVGGWRLTPCSSFGRSMDLDFQLKEITNP